MLTLLTRLFDGATAFAPASLALAGPAPQLSATTLFTLPRLRFGGGRRKPQSPDVKQSWAEFGRGF